MTPIAVKERRRMPANALLSPTSLTPGFMVVHANRLEDLHKREAIVRKVLQSIEALPQSK